MSNRQIISCRAWLFMFAILTIAIGCVGVIGAVMEWNNVTSWGTETPMAPSTAIALISIGIGQLINVKCCMNCH